MWWLRRQIERIEIAVLRIESALVRLRRLRQVRFAVPIYYDKRGGLPMPASITLPDDQQVKVPLEFHDAIGVVHAPVSGGSVSSSDPAVATATLADDDASVTIVSVADGTATVTYTNGAVSDTLEVTVAVPAPTSVDFTTTGAVFSPKP